MDVTFVVLEDTLPVAGSPGQILINVEEIAAIRDARPMIMPDGANHSTSVIWLKGGSINGAVLRVCGSAVEVATNVMRALSTSGD